MRYCQVIFSPFLWWRFSSSSNNNFEVLQHIACPSFVQPFPPIFSCWSFLRCCQHYGGGVFLARSTFLHSSSCATVLLQFHSSFAVFNWEDLFLCFKIVWVKERSIFCWAILILGLCRKLEAGAKQCIRRFSILVTRTWYIALTLRAHKQQKASERIMSESAGTVLSCYS